MVQELPTAAGTGLANWNWKSVRQFVSRRFGTGLSRSSCLTPYQVRGDVTGCNGWDLHSSGSKRHLFMADAAKREEFVAEYAALRDEAGRTSAKTFFADEAHFRAKAELRGKGVPRGKPALVDSNCPRYGEKASYYSAVCLETGEVEWMDASAGSAGGQQQRRNPGGLPVPVAPEALRAAERDLGQRAGTPWRGNAGVPEDTWPGAGTGAPRFHEGRLCRGTARTSMPTRPPGAGRERRPPATCAWEAARRCRSGSANSWPGCPAGKTR